MKHLALAVILATMIILPTIKVSPSADLFRTSSPSNIYINPASKQVQIGQEFTVDVNIDYVSNLYGYEIWVNFDNNKLNASTIDYEDFLGSNPTYYSVWEQEVNNTGGYVSLAATCLKPAPAKTGGSPPPLATIHFKAIDIGNSQLHLSKTVLGDDQAIAIPHTTTDGEVQATRGIHDVAVTAVAAYKIVIFLGFSSSFNVSVENHGGFPETFNVILNATLNGNATTVATYAMTNMLNGTSTDLKMAWGTTGFAIGKYTINATASIVSGETHADDNNFTDGAVFVTMVGDLTGPPNIWSFSPDGKCNILDVSVVAKCFGSYLGAPPPLIWNPNCDVTGVTAGVPDGKVNILDVSLVARHFGEPHP